MSNKKVVKKTADKRIVILINEVKRLRVELTMSRDVNVNVKIGRKEQVLAVLKNATAALSIKQIANEVSIIADKKITTKNISSQLTYLKDDGHKIYKDSDGRKVLSSRLELLQ